MDQWTWPDPPTTPRDIIAGHCRNWGRDLAYKYADTLIIELSIKGFRIVGCDEAITGRAAAAGALR